MDKLVRRLLPLGASVLAGSFAFCLTALSAALPTASATQSPPGSGLAGLPGLSGLPGIAGLHLDVQSFRLDNGMTFLLVEHPDPARVAAGWTAHVGSADDPAGLSGVSHVLEHMLFKGSRTIGVEDPNELDVLYTRAGATSLNAFTRNDLTAYFVSVPANEIELWFWLESDRLLAPVFRDFDGEKKVIEQERRRAESSPHGRLESQWNAVFWQAHPYRSPLLGWPADVAALPLAAVERHFRAYYIPGNLTAVLVGHLDRPRIVELARRYFGRLPAPPEPPRPPTTEPEQGAETRMIADLDGPAELLIRYHSVPLKHPDSYPLEVLAGLLNGEGGRLHRALVLGAGAADPATAAQTSFRTAGYFSVTARARGDQGSEPLEPAWYGVLRRLQEEPVPDAELARVKNRLAVDAFRQLRDPFNLMVQLLTTAGEGGDPSDLDEHARRIAQVSAADVRRVARTYFEPRNRTLALYRSMRTERKP